MSEQAPANETSSSFDSKLRHFVESLEPAERNDMLRILALALAASQNEEVQGYAFLLSTHNTAPGGVPSSPGVQGTPRINAPSYVGDTGGNLGPNQLTLQDLIQLYGPIQWTPVYG